jgi:putative CocE/NonD family hydrolase
MTSGWYDLFTEDMFFWYNNLTVPKRLIVRPVDHSEVEKNQFDLNYAAEAHRWFDRWLKGIHNGIMNEPSIHYYLMGAPKKQAWRSSNQWPLKKQELTRFYFGEGRVGSVASINDGLLANAPSTTLDAFDSYSVDYTTTSGKRSRWMAVNWPRDYPDMRPNDEKALTFTTSPLEADLEITGHPVAHLWLSTEGPDLDLFIYVEEVDKHGASSYITEGNLRVSHRKLGQAPFNNFGLPYHSYYQKDLMQIPSRKPIELTFSLLPTSYRFHRGCQIRIALVCSDADNFDTPVINPNPKLHLLRDKQHASYVQLPVVRSQ